MISLSYTVATPDTNDGSMLAARGPLAQSFAMLAELGYSAVDLMIRDPKLLNAGEILQQAGDCGLRIAAVSTGQFKEDGLSLSHANNAVRSQSVDRTRETIDFAAAFGADVNIGGLRGRLGTGKDRDAALSRARASYEAIGAHSESTGVRVALEPQCRYFADWLPTLGSAAEWNAQFRGARLAVLADLYHMMLEEQSVHAAFIRELPRISTIQVSDSNRQAPGMGHWNFAETIRILQAAGYGDALTVECLQFPDTRAAAAQASRYLLPLLR